MLPLKNLLFRIHSSPSHMRRPTMLSVLTVTLSMFSVRKRCVDFFEQERSMKPFACHGGFGRICNKTSASRWPEANDMRYKPLEIGLVSLLREGFHGSPKRQETFRISLQRRPVNQIATQKSVRRVMRAIQDSLLSCRQSWTLSFASCWAV